MKLLSVLIVAAPLAASLLSVVLPISIPRIRQLAFGAFALGLAGMLVLLFTAYSAEDFVFSRGPIPGDGLGWAFGTNDVHWVFPALLLGLTLQLVLFGLLVLDGQKARVSRYVLVAQMVFMGAALGVLSSPNLLVSAGFLGALVFARFVYHSAGVKLGSLSSVSESAAVALAGVLCLTLVAILQGEAHRALLLQWFRLDLGEYEIVSGSIGFSLFMIGIALVSGLFPFHGSLRRIFEVVPLEKAILGPIQTTVALWILFSVGPQVYLNEMKHLSHLLVAVAVGGLFFSGLFLLAAKQIRGKLFWLQQFMGCFALLGIFQLSNRSWHGALILLVFMPALMALLVSLLVCYSRRGLAGWGQRPRLGILMVLSVLAAFLFPVSAGFYGAVLVFWDALNLGGAIAVLAGVSLPLLFLGARGFFSLDHGVDRDVDMAASGDLGARELLALSPLLLLLLFTGLVPKLILSPLGRVIESYRNTLGI